MSNHQNRNCINFVHKILSTFNMITNFLLKKILCSFNILFVYGFFIIQKNPLNFQFYFLQTLDLYQKYNVRICFKPLIIYGWNFFGCCFSPNSVQNVMRNNVAPRALCVVLCLSLSPSGY